MTRNIDGGYRLPDVIDPDRICVQIYVPNELNHLLAFWAQLEGLGSALSWANDIDHTALLVAEVWREVYDQAREQFYNGGCGMDTECCDDLIAGQSVTNDLLEKILARLSGVIRGEFRFDTGSIPPDVSGGECAPDYFDHNTGDTDPDDPAKRALALCVTVQRYIKGIMLAALREMGAPQFVIDYILATIAQDVPLSLSSLNVSYPILFSGLSVFFALVSAAVSFDALVCLMVDGLSGEKNNTSANFKASVPESGTGLDAVLVPLAALLHASNQRVENYKAFNLALNDAFNEDLSEAECPCAEPPPPDDCGETPLDLVEYPISGSPALVITSLGDNRYKFEQNTVNPAQENSYFGAFQDALGRCLKVEPDPLDEFPQAVQLYSILGCTTAEGDCMSSDISGHGGFAPYNGVAFGFGTGSPMVTSYKVTCCVPTP